MRELYDTSHFTSNTIKDSKPVPFEYKTYCSYCQKEIIKDCTFEDYTRYVFMYCDCEKAEIEKEYKEKLEKLIASQHHEMHMFKEDYKKKGIYVS